MSTMQERWQHDTDSDWLASATVQPPPAGSPLASIQGDLWDMHEGGWTIVVTTNIGWSLRTHENNMGAGVALQAADRWPDLPKWYGRFCAQHAADTPVVERKDRRLIFFPVKPLLDPKNPELSWSQLASPELIERSARQLAEIKAGRIALAYPGAGNGGLPVSVVKPILERYLPGDRFLVVDRRAP